MSEENGRFSIGNYLYIGLKVVVEYIDGDGEVSSVKRVGPVPSLWSKLPPLHHHGMEVDQREEKTLKFILTRTHLKCVLYNKHKQDNGRATCSNNVYVLTIYVYSLSLQIAAITLVIVA